MGSWRTRHGGSVERCGQRASPDCGSLEYCQRTRSFRSAPLPRGWISPLDPYGIRGWIPLCWTASRHEPVGWTWHPDAVEVGDSRWPHWVLHDGRANTKGSQRDSGLGRDTCHRRRRCADRGRRCLDGWPVGPRRFAACGARRLCSTIELGERTHGHHDGCISSGRSRRAEMSSLE